MALKEHPHHSQRDLVVRPNRYAFILDETKGEVRTHVGPLQASLSPNEKPVQWDNRKKRFVDCDITDAVKSFLTAPEGWYISLKNPSKNPERRHPTAGTKNETELDIGRKINIHGPANFALWPGQMAVAIRGHRLRNNQYLVARTYNADAASTHESDTKIETQSQIPNEGDGEGGENSKGEGGNQKAKAPSTSIYPDEFRMGELFIIKGTDVGFYMPPTGIEIVPENKDSNNHKYVREAVTLERLEYCILLDQSGNKRYVQGPDVVFPNATETFVEKSGKRKFKAIELNEQMGLYVKVIAPYEEGGKSYSQGDEIFITGADTKIYYPRHEHSLVRYGDQQKHYATVIPEGEARYVLEKNTGKITLVRGPKTFLPDPRTSVIVRRVLSEGSVQLLFPGNQEALAHNLELLSLKQESTAGTAGGYVSDHMARSSRSGRRSMVRTELYSAERGITSGAAGASPMDDSWAQESAGEAHFGNKMSRGTDYTPPRTITIDSKYDGAVAIQVWSGYAMLLVSKSGRRRVIEGPQTVLLEYDETPEMFSLSKGMPKGKLGKKKDVYLRVRNNRVSDRIDATTKDFVEIDIDLSFRVNFERTGKDFKPENWFAVDNYTQLLSDHMGSVIRNAVKKYGIEEFNASAIDIIRNTVLGERTEDSARPGKFFTENNMKIYDVEVLRLEIKDPNISEMLQRAQRDAVKSQIEIANLERDLNITQRAEEISRKKAKAKHDSQLYTTGLRVNQANIDTQAKLQDQANRGKIQEASAANQMALEKTQTDVQVIELERNKTSFEQEFSQGERLQAQRIAFMAAETNQVVNKFKAISPEFQATLKLFGNRIFTKSLMEGLGAHAMLKGNSVADVFAQLVASSPGLEKVLSNIPSVTTVATNLIGSGAVDEDAEKSG